MNYGGDQYYDEEHYQQEVQSYKESGILVLESLPHTNSPRFEYFAPLFFFVV